MEANRLTRPAIESPVPICNGLSRSTCVKKTTLPVRNVPPPTAMTADCSAIALGNPFGGKILDASSRLPVMGSISPNAVGTAQSHSVRGDVRRGHWVAVWLATQPT
jgi:hypothetical protein